MITPMANAQTKIKQTAGREQLGDFAPKFAELNDDVLSAKYGAGQTNSACETGAWLRLPLLSVRALRILP